MSFVAQGLRAFCRYVIIRPVYPVIRDLPFFANEFMNGYEGTIVASWLV